MVKPYEEEGDTRTFLLNSPYEDFVWHRDEKDRVVTILFGEGWQLQYNGCLPILLEKDKKHHIPAMMYHRLIKGATDLVVKIEE